jgi:hypothetical protein
MTFFAGYTELWLEARVTSGPNRNRVYYISMTTTRDMRLGCNVLTISTPQSGMSHPSPAIEELVEQ